MKQTSERPKPLKDIRYFESAGMLDPGAPMPDYAGRIFDMPQDAAALGQRIARKCEELGVSIGRADHLYICFTPALPEGTVRRTEFALDPWHRFVLCGLSEGFNQRSAPEKFRFLVRLTFDALAAVADVGSSRLDRLQADVLDKGAALRVTLREKETTTYRITVEQTVAVPPSPSEVFARVVHRATSATSEVKVAEVRFHDDAPSLVDRLAVVDDVLVIHPRKSFRAALITKDHELPFRVQLRGQFGA